MALLSALRIWLNSLGFTNRSLRAQVSQLLGAPPGQYTRNQMSYDLARLRRKDLIIKRPGTNTYDLTATVNASRCSTPRSTTRSSAHSSPPTSHPRHPPLRRALATIERFVNNRIEQAAMGKTA